MADKLREFYNDKAMMEEVYNHFIDYLNRSALEKVYEKKDTSAVPEAKEALDGALAELKDRYAEKKPAKPISNR